MFVEPVCRVDELVTRARNDVIKFEARVYAECKKVPVVDKVADVVAPVVVMTDRVLWSVDRMIFRLSLSVASRLDSIFSRQ